MDFRDDYKDRNRASYYSVLYDGFSDVIGSQIRTASEKFLWQGVTTCKTLIRLRMMTEPESAYFLDIFLKRIDPKTRNGAACALVFTTYDIDTKTFITDPKEFIKKHPSLNEKFITEKSWSGLITRIEKIDKQPLEFRELIDKYGITPSSLLRYLLFMQNISL